MPPLATPSCRLPSGKQHDSSRLCCREKQEEESTQQFVARRGGGSRHGGVSGGSARDVVEGAAVREARRGMGRGGLEDLRISQRTGGSNKAQKSLERKHSARTPPALAPGW